MNSATTERLMKITSQDSSRAVIADDISDAEFHLANAESWLGYYDSQLKNMKQVRKTRCASFLFSSMIDPLLQYIRHLEDRNNEMAIVSKNQSAVVSAVEDIFDKLQVDFGMPLDRPG
jgi:hypothetical protein